MLYNSSSVVIVKLASLLLVYDFNLLTDLDLGNLGLNQLPRGAQSIIATSASKIGGIGDEGACSVLFVFVYSTTDTCIEIQALS